MRRRTGLRAAMLALAALVGIVSGTGVAARRQGEGWKPAVPGYGIQLPRDHGAHPETKIEWWYYTGNVATADGRRFGYQLTFFRLGVDPRPENPSRWAVRDLYMAHFAVSDLSRSIHVSSDRLNRGGPGWAGAQVQGYRVWNEDWQVDLAEDGSHRLRARDARFAIDLLLSPGKPPVFHGDRGYSRKGPSDGNASHYYSLTRMPTRGSLTMDGVRSEVTGLSWMDHEWGTSFLERGQVGWDWFSVQLDGGTDVMLFRTRNADGGADAYASGTVSHADGSTTRLQAGDFALEPGRSWTSPASGARYPVEWSVSIPSMAVKANVRAAFPEQELHTEASTSVTYWEGAIEVRGTQQGRPLTGRGYLEMTGYTGRPMSEVLR